MNKNNSNDPDHHSIHLETTQTSTERFTRLCAYFRRRKIMWISIGGILIISAIVIPTTIITLKKKEKTNETTLVTEIVTTTTDIATTKDAEQPTWMQYATTVAGGNGPGNESDQLLYPLAIDIDENYTIYIADTNNHRVVQWRINATFGEVVAGGNGAGNGKDQLWEPLDVVLDKKKKALVICDSGNERIVRWFLSNPQNSQIVIGGIACFGIAIDNNGDLYTSDRENHAVIFWTPGNRDGIIVAGGNKPGDRLRQLDFPTYIFVDEEYSVYISDLYNHRVVKWLKNATTGIVIANDSSETNTLEEPYSPRGLAVDRLGNIYVADGYKHRVMCWSKGAQEGRLVVGGNGQGNESNQFDELGDIVFDQTGNLYVIDFNNHRIQKFNIDLH